MKFLIIVNCGRWSNKDIAKLLKMLLKVGLLSNILFMSAWDVGVTPFGRVIRG